jgi:hypothetical protein
MSTLPTSTAAHAALLVELGAQQLGGELVLGDVGEELAGVDEDGVAADRLDDGDAELLQELAEAADLADAVGEVGLVGDLAQALGEGLHVGAGHAAVGVEALEQDGGGLEALVEEVVAHGDEAAHRDHGVLLGAHDARVGVRAHLLTISGTDLWA